MALNFIKDEEAGENRQNFLFNCSQDISGTGQVIGYGTQCRGRTTITEYDASIILSREIVRVRNKILNHFGEVFNDNQLSMLVSFAYNTPITEPIFNYLESDLKVCIVGNGCEDFFQKFRKYSPSRNNRRRERELNIFSS